MKSFKTILLVLFCGTAGLLNAQEGSGINFFHGTFKEGLALAKAQDKLLFIDCYTTWCGPCRRMSANTFPDANVGTYYNANFICMKIDMEKEEGPQVAANYGVGSYPTLLYLDGEGKVVFKTAGMRGPEDFIALGQDVMKKIDKSGAYEKMYNEGKRDPETVLAYVKALNVAGKSSLKVVNEYISTQKDLGSPVSLDIIFEGAKEADSRVFDYFIQNKSAYLKTRNPNLIDAKIYQCCMKTFQKSLEYRNEELLKLAQEKMKNHSSKEEEFRYNTDMEFYARTGDAAKFEKACNGYVSRIAGKDAGKVAQAAQMCIDFFRTNGKVVRLAEKLAEKAVKLEGNPNQYLLYANTLKLNGKYKDAREQATKGLTMAREKMLPTAALEQLLQELQSN